MKFTNGQWLVRDEYQIINPVEIFDVRQESNKLTVWAPVKPVPDRSSQLDQPLIEVSFSSPFSDVIKVEIDHHKGVKKLGPEFVLYEEEFNPIIKSEDRFIQLRSGELAVTMDKKKGWEIDFTYQGEALTSSSSKNAGHITGPEKQTFMREQLNLQPDETVYGLGERFTPFVKNGQVVDIWNRDGGTSTEQAYKNIPFYLTNKGYGVFVNHPENVSFEVGSENVSKVQFSVKGEHLEYYIVGGGSMKKVLDNYTKLTGKPALPPAWSFGLWLSTSFTTNYDEATVNEFVDGMIERELPLRVFHFDCFWMKEFHWTNFKWDEWIFPDPEEMLGRLKAKGLKICVWINPYIAQRSHLFTEGMANDYLLKKENGDVWQWDLWQPGMGIVDFTNPAAYKWYADKLRELIRMGVDAFKTDFGERIPTDVVYYDRSDPDKMHNYYTHLYNKAVFEVLKEELGEKEAVLFARSATAGGQQFPVHWGGDCTATYPSMAESLRGGLSLGASGFGFWSHDIGGFESNATADVYKRWIAFGLLSSHSRLHGSQSYRVPWLYGEEAVDVLRFFTKLKCSLMPYLYAHACEAAETGLPVMRAMVLEFEEDPACAYLDRQYMLGESLLVAPVFNESGLASYYLPKGSWTNFLTGEKVTGGEWKKEHHDYLSVPLFARENSVVATGSVDSKPDYDYADGITFHLFELREGKTASTSVYSKDGERLGELAATNGGGKITIEVSGLTKSWKVHLRGIKSVESVRGATADSEASGIKLTAENSIIEIVL